MDIRAKNLSGKTRTEKDLLGAMEVPVEYYFGVQTMRAAENFDISNVRINAYPGFIVALAEVKEACARANQALGLLEDDVAEAIIKASKEIQAGKLHDNFIVDVIQGGAGTSVNMNANEVIANRALELLGHEKGEYKYCHPNNHVNLSQSTNDAYPTSVKVAAIRKMQGAKASLESLIESFDKKAAEYKDKIKMGRTQLQDAVPMTFDQEFGAFAESLRGEVRKIDRAIESLYTTNMGATAIGTGINADPDFTKLCTEHLAKITKLPIVAAKNMIAATNCTGVYVEVASAQKQLAVKLSRIANDLRLLSSGPRCGLAEINLPAKQPGSSIMPGKVNPVIAEVMNLVSFRVIGNEGIISTCSEAGQLQLNVMEPLMAYALFENCGLLTKGMDTFRTKCVDGITMNVEHCREMVLNSIGILTILNPYLGYDASNMIAKEAQKTGKGVYELVLEHKLMEEKELQELLKPERMVRPVKFPKNKK